MQQQLTKQEHIEVLVYSFTVFYYVKTNAAICKQTAAVCPCIQDFGHVLVDYGVYNIKLKWC